MGVASHACYGVGNHDRGMARNSWLVSLTESLHFRSNERSSLKKLGMLVKWYITHLVPKLKTVSLFQRLEFS